MYKTEKGRSEHRYTRAYGRVEKSEEDFIIKMTHP
jgi:hypothetical protein